MKTVTVIRAFLLFVLVDLLIILILFASRLHSQTLQRRTEPVLQPESCRSIMNKNRDIFRKAAAVETVRVTRRELLMLTVDLDSPSVVDSICANPKLAATVNLKAALAQYRMVVK